MKLRVFESCLLDKFTVYTIPNNVSKTFKYPSPAFVRGLPTAGNGGLRISEKFKRKLFLHFNPFSDQLPE